MIDSEKMVKAINHLNLRHRRGWYPSEGIGKIPDGKHFMNEAEELVQALEHLNSGLEWDRPNEIINEREAHVLEEMGDVFATILQIGYRLGFTFEQINQEAVRKMRMRFDNADKVDLSEYSEECPQ